MVAETKKNYTTVENWISRKGSNNFRFSKDEAQSTYVTKWKGDSNCMLWYFLKIFRMRRNNVSFLSCGLCRTSWYRVITGMLCWDSVAAQGVNTTTQLKNKLFQLHWWIWKESRVYTPLFFFIKQSPCLMKFSGKNGSQFIMVTF